MKVFYVMIMTVGVCVLALSLVALGWEIAERYSARHATVECYPGETLAHIPLEIKPLCIRTEHGR
jgi:hypothetical protein